jgi:hypothetical protein
MPINHFRKGKRKHGRNEKVALKVMEERTMKDVLYHDR